MISKLFLRLNRVRHRVHVEDITEAIVIPLPLKAPALSVHRGTLH